MEELRVAMVIAVDNSGKVLALKKNLEEKSKPRYQRNPWETPGGKLMKNETFQKAASRELREETGLKGELGTPEKSLHEDMFVEKFLKGDNTDEWSRIEFYPTLMLIDSTEPVPNLSSEHSDFEWLEFEEFRSKLPDHNIEALEKATKWL